MKKYLLYAIAFFLWGQMATAQADLELVTGSLTASPASIHVGITLDITFSVQNVGDATSGKTIIGLYLSTTEDISVGGKFLGNISFESLAAGELSSHIQCKFPVPYTITNSDDYKLIVKINPYETLTEKTFSNNTAITPVHIDASPWAAQNLPYPIIFVHGYKSDNKTWDDLINSMKNYFGWSSGGNMNFCLNYDRNLSTSNSKTDFKDFTDISTLNANDYYTVNFNVNYNGVPYTNAVINESNQSGIAKQGLAISEAIKHVLAVTHRDKVILVCHSMGGLAAREYLQNPALWKDPNINHHVAKLVTIGTPHGGTNVSDFGEDLTLYADMYSEAIRDLRTSYLVGNAGVYLFGGVEDLNYMYDHLNPLCCDFYNADVNCNGVVGELIVGLNQKDIRQDLSYSCLIGEGNLLMGNWRDGIVGTYQANINNYLSVGADTFILKQPSTSINPFWHIELTSQFSPILKGIDEPNSWISAYEVKPGTLTYGLITEQSKGNAQTKDFDTYLVNLPASGALTVQLYNIQLTQFSVQVYNSSKTPVGNIIYSNGKSNMNVTIPSLSKGKYYVVFSASPSSVSWSYPYAFQLTYTASIPSFCSGTTNLTAATGTFSDGSGTNNYNNNSDCKWKIQPSGATSITLNFSAFSVNDPNDTVYVYDGGTTTSALLGKWTGNSIPASVTSTGGTLLVRFSTDAANTSAGWTADYTAVVVPVYCNGTTTLTTSSGSFSDGSGTDDYGNNSHCSWLINPPGSYAVTLNFTAFNTEAGNDVVNIYDGSDNTADLLGSFSGNTIPASITSSGGSLFVEFVSNASVTNSGWSADFTSVIPEPVEGIVSYEYWFDDDYMNAVPTPVKPQIDFQLKTDIPATELPEGLHSFHIRFLDHKDRWSSTESSFLYKPRDYYSGAAQYEYWFDDDYLNKISADRANTNHLVLLDSFATTGLNTGLHVFHIRFKLDGKQWSSVNSSFFYKQNTSLGKLINYQYWIDNNEQDAVSNSVTETDYLDLIKNIDLGETTKGLHVFNIRFKNTNGTWSSISSSFFYNTSLLDNKIVKYRYWFDTAFAALNTITLTTPVSPYELLKDVCIADLRLGSHIFNIQFLDSAKTWSSIVSDTFYKASTSGSTVTTNGSATFCEGGNITLTASSCNNCTYKWSNGSTLQSIVVLQSGNYYVKIDYGNDCIQISDTIKVTVNTTPSQPGLINGNTSVTTGQTLAYNIANVSGAESYLWYLTGGGNITGGQNTNSINVNWLNGGNYTLSVKAINSCGQSNSQSLGINVSFPTGFINLDDQFQIRINPNPSTRDFYLKVEGAQNKRIAVCVMNLLGQEIFCTNNQSATNSYTELIDLKNVVNGIYYVKIIIDKKIYIRKIIKL